MNWATRKLDEIADFQLGKMLDDKKNKGDPLPYLANLNVRWGEFELNDLRLMRFQTAELERFSLKYGDIVMCEGGEPGRCAIWKEQLPKMMYQKALHRIRPREGVDHQFLYYAFLHKGKRGGFSPLFTGSTIKHLPKQQLAKVEVNIPELSTQQRIAALLSKYDDLIENNKRRIELLEESARQLYKEWFVRFRFPGHEHVKIIDGVPDGWSFKPLKDIASLTMGQSPKSEFYNSDGDGLPFHQGVTKFGFRFVEHETYCTKPTRLSQPGDILFSVRAPVGRMNITNDVIVLGRGLSAIHSVEGFQSFLFYALKSYFFKEDMIGGGAIYASVTKKDMENQELLIPTESLLNEFNDFGTDIDKQIYNLHQMNVNLIKARDILLPKLMNGEIAV